MSSLWTVCICYTSFSEVFEVNLQDNFIDINLSKILINTTVSDTEENLLIKLNNQFDYVIDFNLNYKSTYLSFPWNKNRLFLYQKKNKFHFFKQDNFLHEFTLSSKELVEYILNNQDFLHKFVKVTNEDATILINSFFNDYVQNDYSANELNRKIKYLKLFYLLNCFNHIFPKAFDGNEIVTDETVLGDFPVSDLALSFASLKKPFLKVAKIDNFSKIVNFFCNSGIINNKQYDFHFDTYVLNTVDLAGKGTLIFRSQNKRFDYSLVKGKNYYFALDTERYDLSISNKYNYEVQSNVFVYNGDEKDFLLKK